MLENGACWAIGPKTTQMYNTHMPTHCEKEAQ